MNSLQAYVVDDDADVRKGLIALLESAGYPVRVFGSAPSFLDSVMENIGTLAGCLILDVRMPEMDGMQLQRKLVERQCALPIIFLTGHGELPEAVEAMRKGAFDFLVKPVDGRQLLERVGFAWQQETERCRLADLQLDIRERLNRLSARERQVLAFALNGLHNQSIATTLGLSQRTVEAHRSRLLLKLDAASVQNWLRHCEQAGLPSARLIELLGRQMKP